MPQEKKSKEIGSKAQLSIYTASAGAGKTHTLTGQYLKLAIKNPSYFRHIQAVTFTNKATTEMKDRILQELFKLSKGEQSGFSEELMQELQLDKEQLREKSATLLQTILCDYSAFRIKTIDSFFQEVMRAFAYELGLNGRYSISFEQDLLLEEAVKQVLQKLDPDKDRTTADWVEKLIRENIEEGKSYNVTKDLRSIGQELFKEGLAALIEKNELPSNEDIVESQKQMQTICSEFLQHRLDIANEAIRLIEENALALADFKNGNRSAPNEFYKIIKGKELALPGVLFWQAANPDPELQLNALITASKPAEIKARIAAAHEQGLGRCFVELGKLYTGDSFRAYNSSIEMLKQLNRLGLVAALYREILELKQHKGIMLISDAPTLLHRIIDNSDTPFIYEKVGVRIKQQMIDEFQDTSRLQYKNFQPLLFDSLAQGNDNLVVGDVKQSIYRFRNADSSLLGRQIKSDFAPYAKPILMHENWRSRPEIVAFNNALFPALAAQIGSDLMQEMEHLPELQEELQQMIVEAYADAPQKVAKPNEKLQGYLRIYTADKDYPPAELQTVSDAELQTAEAWQEEGAEETTQSWQSRVCQSLPKLVIDLQKRGYAAGDIAILVRKKKEAALVAEAFNEYIKSPGEEAYSTEFVSEEALYINNALSVRFIVNLLRLIQKPQHESIAHEAYQSYLAMYFSRHGKKPEQQGFGSQEIERILSYRQQSAYEQVDALINCYYRDIPPNENAYLLAFLDLAYQFSNEEQLDASAFIKWWQLSAYKECISSSVNPNAVNILTIHKSKGLGFRVLLLPMVDWKMDEINNQKPLLLWCPTAGTPFAKLGKAPLKYGSKLLNTYFERQYFEERGRRYLDSLNLLYVATTRAKDELYIWLDEEKPKEEKKGGDKEKKKEEKKAAQSIDQALRPRLQEMLQEGLLEEDEYGYKLGRAQQVKRKEQPQSKAYHITMDRMRYQPIGHKLAIKLEGTEHYRHCEAIAHGILMHQILASIEQASDLAAALEEHMQAGNISSNEAAEIQQRLEERISKPDLAGYFDGSGEVLNEQAILLPNGSIRRPDRIISYPDRTVLIDYKFGDARPEHQRQLRYYAELLRQMDYPQPEAYLLYLESGELRSVSLD